MNEAARNLEPWQWPEEHWRSLVNHVRAGRSLRPAVWKDGARCALALSFDSDHETNELREGGKSFGRMSWGQFGNRVGVRGDLRRFHALDVTLGIFTGEPLDFWRASVGLTINRAPAARVNPYGPVRR